MGAKRRVVGWRVGDFDTGRSLARGKVAQDEDDVKKINSSKMGNGGEDGGDWGGFPVVQTSVCVVRLSLLHPEIAP
jgi:hypothetical protein